MKKALFICAVLFMAASLSSCKKNWTCTCTAAGQSTQTYPIDGTTQSAATSSCNSYGTSLTAASLGTATYSCSVN